LNIIKKERGVVKGEVDWDHVRDGTPARATRGRIFLPAVYGTCLDKGTEISYAEKTFASNETRSVLNHYNGCE